MTEPAQEPTGQPAAPTAVPPAATTQPAPAAEPTGGQPAAPEPKAADPAPSADPKPTEPQANPLDQYKGKGWVDKVKNADGTVNLEALLKQVDNLDSVAGKKVVVPDLEKATPEEREAYFAQTRPKDPSAYVFDDEMAPEVKELMTSVYLENGTPAFVANNITQKFREFENKLLADAYDPEKFKESMKSAFGDDWEKVTGHTHNALKHLMNEADNELMGALPNKYASLIYRALGAAVKAYGITEKPGGHEAGMGNPAPADINAQRDSLRDQIAALKQKPHTSAEMQALKDKLNDTYKNDPRRTKAG